MKSEFFIPAFELNKKTFETCNSLLGKNFNTRDFSVYFNRYHEQLLPKDEFVQLSIESMDVQGCFYISYSEIKRMLGVGIKLLDKEYVEYIFEQSVGKYGVKFNRFLNEDESRQLSRLISMSIYFNGSKLSSYFVIDGLYFDIHNLAGKITSWPKELRLSTDHVISSILLDLNKISELSSDDLIVLKKNENY